MWNNKQVMNDRWNSKWQPPPSWIYYFCPFWSSCLFPVAAVYNTAKFNSSTSIGGWVIAVCGKIQDGGHRHLGFYFYLRQAVNVFAGFCLSVCVSKIIQKVMDGSFWNFEGISDVA